MSAAYLWRYRAGDDSPLGESEVFASQDDAEAFMGARWAELYDSGVRSVALIRDGETVYDMSLEAG